MGSLLSVMAKEMDAWPDEQKYFTCDPSGEIRASLDIQYDFYPKESVDVSDRTDQHAGMGDDMPRVTKDQWQAERDKQNSGEWKRHRGGKCPVPAGTKVSTRHRNGEVVDVHFHTATTGSGPATMNTIWKHTGDDHDIMQYKVISEPQAEEVEMKGPFVVNAANQESTEIVLDDFIESGTWHEDQIDGPIKWRDTVNELDAYIEEFTRERESLINRLALEGFALLPAMTAVMGVSPFSLPFGEWKEGDIVTSKVDYNIQFTKGKKYTVTRTYVSLGENRVSVLQDDKGEENGWNAKHFEFHSRP